MQITPSGLDALYYNFLALYQGAYTRTPTWSDKVATTVPSTTRQNRYPWMERIPKMRQWLGERVVHNLAARVYTLDNLDFELTVGVSRNDIEDDNFGTYTLDLQMMGEQAKKWQDQTMKGVLQAGTTNLAFDGQYYFDTDHPVNMDDSASATYANLFTTKPLTPANYNTVR
jgi:phage major head subunit gpT-like protein